MKSSQVIIEIGAFNAPRAMKEVPVVTPDRVWANGLFRRCPEYQAKFGDVILGNSDWHVLIPNGDPAGIEAHGPYDFKGVFSGNGVEVLYDIEGVVVK